MSSSVVSVIVPVYRAEKYLRRCLDSIAAQVYTDFEVILIDDGSPDQSGAICDEYSAKDHRFNVIHKENEGVASARNAGIAWCLNRSDSQYVTFVDSDDWIHPEYIKILVDCIEVSGTQVSMIGSVYSYVYSDNFTHYGCSAEPQILNAEELFLARGNDFNYPCGKLYRKTVFRGIQYPDRKIYEDVSTTYRILFSAERIALLDVGLYFYFHNNEGICHSPWKPTELVIFEAMRQQMSFFAEHGYEQAYQKEHRLYLNHFAYEITRIRDNKQELNKNRQYIKQLRSEMLHIIRESNGKYNYRNMPQCYEAAYPRLTELLRLMRATMRIAKSDGIVAVVQKIQEIIKR